jgi:hypothetical protein
MSVTSSAAENNVFENVVDEPAEEDPRDLRSAPLSASNVSHPRIKRRLFVVLLFTAAAAAAAFFFFRLLPPKGGPGTDLEDIAKVELWTLLGEREEPPGPPSAPMPPTPPMPPPPPLQRDDFLSLRASLIIAVGENYSATKVIAEKRSVYLGYFQRIVTEAGVKLRPPM